MPILDPSDLGLFYFGRATEELWETPRTRSQKHVVHKQNVGAANLKLCKSWKYSNFCFKDEEKAIVGAVVCKKKDVFRSFTYKLVGRKSSSVHILRSPRFLLTLQKIYLSDFFPKRSIIVHVEDVNYSNGRFKHLCCAAFSWFCSIPSCLICELPNISFGFLRNSGPYPRLARLPGKIRAVCLNFRAYKNENKPIGCICVVSPEN